MTTQDPCALVTGAGRGLGRAIAERFHAEGYHVVATDYDEDLLKDLEGVRRYSTMRHDVSDVDAAAPCCRRSAGKTAVCSSGWRTP